MGLSSSVVNLEKWQALCPCKVIGAQPDGHSGQKCLWARAIAFALEDQSIPGDAPVLSPTVSWAWGQAQVRTCMGKLFIHFG